MLKSIMSRVVFQMMMMNLLLFHQSIMAQSEDYTLFRKAIEELNAEYQAKKPQCQANYEKSLANIQPYQQPSVTVMGGTEEQNKEMEEVIEKAIAPPPSDEQLKSKDASAVKPVPSEETVSTPQKEKAAPIQFTSTAMFPGEPQGEVMVPNGTPREEKPIEWSSTEWTYHEESIAIEDIKDPVEKKKWQDIEEHESNILELNRIGLIGAMHKQSSTVDGYYQMNVELEKAGFELTSIFLQAKLAETDKRVEVLKNGIVGMTTQILTK